MTVSPRDLDIRTRPGAVSDVGEWVDRYLRNAIALDGCAALAAGLIALYVRYHRWLHLPTFYFMLTLSLPIIWIASVALARGYEDRVIGAGPEEFRRVINAGIGLTAVIAIASYAAKAHISRGYMLLAMPLVVCFDLASRYALRKHLQRMRVRGACMRRAIAVGHLKDVGHLISEFRREPYHGLSVVAACVVGHDTLFPDEIEGVPVKGGLSDVVAAVGQANADTVAVLACPELNGTSLRQLAWDLEKTDTDLCLAPALLDVAGPRTTIRAAGGLPLLYVDHPDLSGLRQVLKSVFDKFAAAAAILVLSPLLITVAIMIRMEDGGTSLYRQVRLGKDGQPYRIYKFRSMVMGADKMKADLADQNEVNGVLFKMKKDPRLTKTGVWIRAWSVDELPQLFNVLRGEMSMVGPRPWAPRPYEEAAANGNHVWRRVAVRPGLTGLWQVSDRADLPWEESVRLDLRYVENWSFALDLQIMWKTLKAVLGRSGAY
ncbi:MAG TPA: sugar transferase [Streptosporangiaceae bacterium]|nr:sugar transferase [Streptosporangiaceae bacterium]